MGGKAPSPFSNAFDGPQFGSLRYNTSQAGSPIPVVYGTQRVSCNLLEFWDFSGPSHPPGSKGGKGFGSSSGKKNGGNYSVYVAFGVCQGPVSDTGAQNGIGGNNRIFANGGIAAGLSNVSLNGYGGDDGQQPDAVFESKDPNQPVIGYSGTAYVTGTPMQLGQSPVLPDIQFEISGFYRSTAGPTYPDDARPDYILVDLLTNPRYGAGFPARLLDNGGIDSTAYGGAGGSLGDYGTYCQAGLLGMSLVMDRMQAASRWLDEITKLSNAAVVWTGTLLKIVPYGDQEINQNGADWKPNLAYAAILTDNEFLPQEHSTDGKPVANATDPIQYDFSDPQTIHNWLPVEYQDSINYYNQQISPTFDQGQIDQFGLKVKASLVAHEFTNPVSAGLSGFLALEREIQIRTRARFKLGWKWCLLEPMDIVIAVDAGGGFAQQPFRLTGYEEDDNGDLSFEAEEIPGYVAPDGLIVAFGANTASQYARSGGSNGAGTQNFQGSVSSVNQPFIFEPTAGQLSANGDSTPLLVIGLSAGPTAYDPNWGGADIYVSTDNETYTFFGTFRAPMSTMGVLAAPLPAYSGPQPDTADALAADLTQSEGTLQSYSAALAAQYVPLCAIQPPAGGDYELLAYENATLTAPSQYDLTTLYRGLYCTTAAAHNVNDLFLFLADGNYFFNKLPPQWIGRQLYFKFTSFNKYGASEQSLSDVVAWPYTPAGTGYGTGAGGVPQTPAGLTASAQSGAVLLTWNANESCDNVTGYRIFRGAGLNDPFSGTTQIAEVSGLQYLDSGLAPGSQWTYCIEAVNAVGASGAVCVNATVLTGGTSGVPATPTGLVATAETLAAQLSWNANPASDAVTGYELYRAAGLGASFSGATLIWTGLATGHTDTPLAGGSQWTYFLEACNAIGCSAPTAGASVTVLGAVADDDNDTVASVAAAGSTQAGATALAAQFNIVTSVPAGAGVALPAAVAGAWCKVRNSGANPLLVYPANGSGAAINAEAANAPIILQPNTTAYFEPSSAAQWFSIP